MLYICYNVSYVPNSDLIECVFLLKQIRKVRRYSHNACYNTTRRSLLAHFVVKDRHFTDRGTVSTQERGRLT